MKKIKTTSILQSILISSISFNIYAGGSCTPNISTSFTDFENMAFRITNNVLGENSLYSQCTDLSSEALLGALNNCLPLPTNPINGLGLNPTNKLLYGLSPTDSLGISTHLEMTVPFPSPGQPGDIMKADAMDIYKIGNDAGFQRVGSIQPPVETAGLPAGTHQVVPIVHSAASFNQAGDLFVLAYRTNYTSSANVPAGTAEVIYQAPKVVIGKVNNANLTSANGGNIPITWTNITMDSTCDAVVDKFKDDTNVFSVCVVDEYLITGDETAAVENCLASTPILDKGIHDFAVSPLNGHLYGYDSMTFDDKDVLVDMNPISNVASCTEIADPGNSTGVLSTVMFSKQNKLVTIFANQTNGSWIDVNTGIRTILPSSVTAAPYSDGSSLPFAGFLRITKVGTPTDVIFENGFESINDNIFSNGFESAGFVDLDFIKSGVFVDTNDDMLAQAGESIEYSFSLSNTGSVALNSLSISDPLMTVAGSLANLPVAATDNSTFSGTYVLTQTDVDNGEVSNLATANVQDPESNSLAVLSNSGVPLITNLATSAEVSLVKSGIFVDSSMDGFAQAGETIEYSFTVTNTGTQTLHNISITDPLLSISGSLASLSPSASDSITFSGTYILTQANVDNGFVSNLARVNSSDPSNNTVTSLSNTSTPLITNLPSVNSMSLIKSGVFVDTINDGAAGVGDKINYTFNVTNTGTQTLNNITISDALMSVPGAIPNLGVSASDSTTLKGNYVLKQADIDAGFVSNLATANAFDPSTNPISATSNAGSPLITNLSPTASISIVKSGSYVDLLNVGFVEPGDEIHYSFTVTNTGTQTLSAISISDPLVTVAGFLSSLAPSAIDSSTFSAVYTLTQDDVDATFVANTATVNAEDPSSSPISANSNNVVTNFTPTASISLVKSGVFADTNMDGLAQEGELINYAFVVKNTGSLTLSNISITDPKLSVAGSLASLAVSATDNSTFSGSYALTQVDIDAGFVSNLATVNAEDPSTNPVSASSNSGVALITNLPTNASMSLVKSAVFNDASMDGLAQVGETIDYSFTLTNTGNLTLTNLSISDPLMTVSGNLASLSVSTSDNSTFSGTYVLTQSDIDSGMVSNLATANATDPFMDPVSVQSNSGASLITNLPTLASMSLTKTGVFNDTNMDGFAQVGESIDYTFTISNTGNMTLTNISISDPKISVSGALASLAVSASDNSTFSGSYVLTQADIDAGFVSNLATANASDPALNLVTVQSNGGSATITNLPIFSCPEF